MNIQRGAFLPDRNAYIASEEPCIFHCHHYNTYLQAVIEDASAYLDVYPVLIDSARETAFAQFSLFFQEKGLQDENARKEAVEEYFCFSGFGKLSLAGLGRKGGEATAAADHYGFGWKSKFGLRSRELSGVSFFTAGYAAGAMEAVYGLPLGSFNVSQNRCIAKGDEDSSFNLALSGTAGGEVSPKGGAFQTYTLTNHPDSAVNYVGIRAAVGGMPLEGRPQNGLIEAFGVLLTRMYSNYYCLISYRFLKLFEEKMGSDGISIAQQLLTEAGHVCAFNTFGGIMLSAEWNGLIKPMLANKDEWVHGMTAVVNALCWGFWEVAEFIPGKRLAMKITSGYEPNSFIQKYGASNYPISFLANGGVAGIMNLIYLTGITEGQISLDNTLYKDLHSKPHFQCAQTMSREMGDPYDLFVAEMVS